VTPPQPSPKAGLPPERIAQAVAEAGLDPLATGVAENFSRYYVLLEKWNSRLNLTAIRDPEEALRRHFLECIFCAQRLPAGISTLLDYGSGAGFPGIPIALCRAEIQVTLAESQSRKASFLREALRSLEIAAEVYGGRVQAMPTRRIFDAVCLRAVDKMQEAVDDAASRVKPKPKPRTEDGPDSGPDSGADGGGWLVLLASADTIQLPECFSARELAIPGSESGRLILASRT